MLACYRSIAVIVILAGIGCSGVQDESRLGPAAPATQPTGEGALSGAFLDAMDLAIVQHSLGTALNPVSLSAALKRRLSKYESGVTFESEVGNVRNSFADGVSTELSSTPLRKGAGPSVFSYTFQGRLEVSIQIIEGEIGLRDGDVYVKEGTRALVDGRAYKYQAGFWIEAT